MANGPGHRRPSRAGRRPARRRRLRPAPRRRRCRRPRPSPGTRHRARRGRRRAFRTTCGRSNKTPRSPGRCSSSRRSSSPLPPPTSTTTPSCGQSYRSRPSDSIDVVRRCICSSNSRPTDGSAAKCSQKLRPKWTGKAAAPVRSEISDSAHAWISHDRKAASPARLVGEQAPSDVGQPVRPLGVSRLEDASTRQGADDSRQGPRVGAGFRRHLLGRSLPATECLDDTRLAAHLTSNGVQ